MPLFSRKAKQPTTPIRDEAPPPPADSLVGDPNALRFRAELAAGRWWEFHDFLETVPNWTLRSFYINNLADIQGRPEWLDDWAAARPDSALPFLFGGRHRAIWAWQARGDGRAHTVEADAWPVFQSRLAAADRDLARAAALDARDPTPHAASIWVAIGLSLGQEELRRRFMEAERREHLNIGACWAMIQGTARKWGGSHEAMFQFARWVSEQAPEGHSGHKMIALAHVERWLDLPKEDQPAYFIDKRVKSEVHWAADRSIRSPLYPGGVQQWSDRNAFAFCFWLMKDYEALLEQMRFIGPRITPAPWHYLGNPGRAYERARQAALQASGPSSAAAGIGRPSL